MKRAKGARKKKKKRKGGAIAPVSPHKKRHGTETCTFTRQGLQYVRLMTSSCDILVTEVYPYYY